MQGRDTFSCNLISFDATLRHENIRNNESKALNLLLSRDPCAQRTYIYS